MKLFSAFGAATVLEKDRQTIARALRHVAPDGYQNKSPRWRLPTIIKALERTNGHIRRDWNSELPQLIDQIEADFVALDVGFAKLKAEPNLERRRKIDKQLGVGRLIGDLDRRMRKAHSAIGEERGLSALVGEHLIGDLISRFLTLLDYWPSDAEMENLRAEGEARKPMAANA